MTEQKKDLKRNIIIIITAVIVVIVIGVGIYFMRNTGEMSPPPVVGSIDRDKVFETEEFRKASGDLEKLAEQMAKEFEEATKNLDVNNEEDMAKYEKLYMEYQEKMTKKTNEVIFPNQKRAEAAVAQVAVRKKMNTVLDKQIVVCGAEDITEEVLKYMKEHKDVKMPEDKALNELKEKATIGYFDKEVVLSLNEFQQVDIKMQQITKEAQQKYEEQVKKLTEEQALSLEMMMAEELKKLQDDLYAPLFRQVNRTVKKVAEEKQLDLVVNKEHVMWGGKNITDEVASELTGVKHGSEEATP